MDEKEPGQLGNREIITVCIAVSLAVILVASLMPAMLPQGGGEDEPFYYSTIDEDANNLNHVYYNNGETTSQTAGHWINEGYITLERASSGYPIVRINSVSSGGYFEGAADHVTFYTSSLDPQTISTPEDLFGGWGMYMQADSADLAWAYMTCPTVVLPGETPEPPEPSGGSDSTTAIVMAIIAIIFLGIALTALRTVLPGRGGQRCPREPASARSTRPCARPTTGSVRGSPEGSTTHPVRSDVPNPRHPRPR